MRIYDKIVKTTKAPEYQTVLWYNPLTKDLLHYDHGWESMMQSSGFFSKFIPLNEEETEFSWQIPYFAALTSDKLILLVADIQEQENGNIKITII